MKSNMCRRPGFTVVELVISIVILAIVSFILAKVFQEGARIWTRSSEQGVISSSARNSVIRISRTILDASTINIPNLSYVNFSYDSDSNGSQEFCSFSLASNSLMYQVGAATPLTLATGITSLSFGTVTNSNPTYSVEFIIDLKAKDKGKDIEFRTKVIPRVSRI